MRFFSQVLQQVLLVLLIGIAPQTLTACSENVTTEKQSLAIVDLVISPEEKSVDIGASVEFSITQATFLRKPDGESQDIALSTQELDVALADERLTQAEYDFLKKAAESIEWSSEDDSVASVSGTGRSATARANSEGNADIVATLPMRFADPDAYASVLHAAEGSGKEQELENVSVRATLSAVPTNDSIVLNDDSVSVFVGTSVDLDVELMDSEGNLMALDDSEVTYTSSDETIATVDADGVVTGVGEGTATITAEYDGFPATAEVTVSGVDIGLTTAAGDSDGAVSIGGMVALEVGTIDVNGDPLDITSEVTSWSSSNESIATVDDNGVVTGVSVGTVDITVEVNGWLLQIPVTVLGVELEVTPRAPVIAVNGNLQLTASLMGELPPKITNSDATWESADESVVAVDANGVITGIGVGSADITATFGGNSVTLTVDVVAGQALVVSPISASVVAGLSEQLSATLVLYDGSTQDVTSSARWSSDDEAVATVDSNGLVTGESKGDATVTATYGGLALVANITVLSPEVGAVLISPNPVAIPLGDDLQLTAILHFTDGSTLDVTETADWYSDDIAVSVDAGLVQSNNMGSAIITATALDVEGTAVVTVVPIDPIAISVEPTELSIPTGTSQRVTLSVLWTNGDTREASTTVTVFSSSDESVASVADGVITGNSPGSAVISATLLNMTAEIPVTVTEPVVWFIGVAPSYLWLGVGDERELSATATLTDGTTLDVTEAPNLTWSSTDSTVAGVEQTGLVSGVSMGQTTIVATYDDGVNPILFDSTNVSVSADGVALIRLTPTSAEIPVGLSQEFSAVATFTDATTGNITDSVAWNTEDPSIATVVVQDGVAVVSGVAPGTTQLTVTRDSVTATATITVVEMDAGSN